MSKSEETKDNFSKFMAGRGFYVVLALCLVGSGAAAWSAVNRTIGSIEEQNSQMLEASSLPEEPSGFSPLEEAAKSQSGVTAPSSPSSMAPDGDSSSQQEPAEPSEASAVSTAVPAAQPISFVMPLQGEVLTPFSNGELVKNTTLNEWRTHNGVDIQSPKGSQVLAIADGVVQAVRADPVWGVVVEIDHGQGLIASYYGLGQEITLQQGDAVQANTPIGVLDMVPCEQKLPDHLHLEIKQDGQWVDPMSLLKG